MGTRAKIRIETKGKYVCATYFNMDGHVENWAPILITALRQTTPETILKNRQLICKRTFHLFAKSERQQDTTMNN